MLPSLGLRPVEPSDTAFLFQLYASTRQAELAAVPWTAEAKQAFLQQQFAAQQHHYTAYYAGASFQVVLSDAVPIGRLYLAHGEHEIRIVDIALLPEHRGHGLGSTLLRGVMAEAIQTAKSVTIHVEKFNPALRLYQRLGFQQIEDKGVHLLLDWHSAQPVQAKIAS